MSSAGVNPYDSRTQPPSNPKSKSKVDAVYEDESSKDVSVDDFLNLMVAQMQNQDPMNPMEDTQYVTQLAQFATMQQMQELAYYSKSNFVMSMVGKEVTVAQNKIGGDITVITGPVEKVSLVNNEYKITVDGKQFDLNQIMEIHPPAANDSPDADDVITDLGLSLVGTTPNSATVSWEIPTLEQNPDRDRLRYSVYYSTDDRMDTVEEVKKYGRLSGKAEQTGIDEMTIDELAAGGTYYINVIVKDIHGKESVYKKQVVVMPKRTEEERV